jgi:homocysteine S-methyltransferase
MDFLETFHSEVIVADGAMGTELLRRASVTDAQGICLEEWCVTQPEAVTAVHRDYLAAGARLIRTHSFGSNEVRLRKWGLDRRIAELNWMAARLAKEAAKGAGAWVAASVGPVGLTKSEREAQGIDLRQTFEEQLGPLLDGGAQCVVFETFTDLEELCIALEVKQSLHHCPAIASVVCDSRGQLSGGIALGDAWRILRENGADIVGVNCAGTPDEILRAIGSLAIEDAALFPSAGLPGPAGRYALSEDSFAEGIMAAIARGFRLVGGCCGTTPMHIGALSEKIGANRS